MSIDLQVLTAAVFNRLAVDADGAMVRVLRSSSENLTLLVYYEGATTEIYSFFKEKDGKSKFSILTNKTGNGALIQKSSVMVGDCDPIRFNLIR